MVIVVEGPDGAGKTTLIEVLKNELDLTVAPRVVSKETKATTNLRLWVDNNLKVGFQPVIFDRYRLISETIYGPALRDTSEEGFDDMHWLAPRLNQFYRLRPIIIYCLPPLETVLTNTKDDPDNTAVVSKIRGIYSAYVARASLDLCFAPGSVYIWDYTKHPNAYPGWLNTIKAELRERAL